MRRTMIWAAALWFLASAGFSQESSIKLSGGFGFATGGDLNKTIKGTSDIRRDLDGALGELKPVNLGLNFDIEFIHHFTPNIGLGLGIGYFRASKESGPVSSEFAIPGIFSMGSEYSINPKISAVPITLNVHYFLPAGSRISFDLHAGIGYYLTMLNFSSKDVLSDSFFDTISEHWTEDTTFASTKGSVGFQAGIGFEFDVAKRVAVVCDVFGRFASVSGFKGKYEYKESGDYTWEESASDYYFWSYDERFDGSSYTQFDFYTEKPEGETVTNAKQGSIDLTGFGITLGLRIKF
jgi:hypothetical protein